MQKRCAQWISKLNNQSIKAQHKKSQRIKYRLDRDFYEENPKG